MLNFRLKPRIPSKPQPKSQTAPGIGTGVAVEARLASTETDLKLGFVDKFTASVGADLLIHEVTNKKLALHINIKQ